LLRQLVMGVSYDQDARCIHFRTGDDGDTLI
jgi:hypothetical protein